MLPMALRLLGVCVLCHFSSSLATPGPLYGSLEGSTDEEELGNVTSFFNSSVSLEPQTTPGGPAQVESVMSRVVNFLGENLLLLFVSGFFLLLIFLIICGAVFMSRRRRVNAYFPSSFPSKMYVDPRDKTGGAKPFNELPDKPAPEQQQEPVDSHKQLQADIMRAAKSLRTPNKPVDAALRSGSSHKAADHNPEDGCNKDGGVRDQQMTKLPEEELSQPSAAAEPRLNPPQEDGSQGPPTCSSPRPSSLHIHNDSAALQLIAGEKTAF